MSEIRRVEDNPVRVLSTCTDNYYPTVSVGQNPGGVNCQGHATLKPGVSRAMFLTGNKLIQAIGQIQFLVVVGLRSLLPCWLPAKGWSLLLGTVTFLLVLSMWPPPNKNFLEAYTVCRLQMRTGPMVLQEELSVLNQGV